jgi:hypothetical protein
LLRKLIIILFSVFLVVSIIIGIIYNSHSIVLKWISGTARIIGKPIKVIVYTNGEINQDIKVYKVGTYWNGQKANTFLISLKEFDKEGKLKFINIDLSEKWIGRPVCTNVDCYDFINDRLFQSETGGHFAPFQDDMKGYNFDPQLIFTKTRIEFNIPPNQLKYDSIRIVL